MTPRPKFLCVSSICVKCVKIFISSCGIILILFYPDVYLLVRVDGILCAGVLSVPTLVYGSCITHATLGYAVVSNLSGATSPAICSGGLSCILPVSI